MREVGYGQEEIAQYLDSGVVGQTLPGYDRSDGTRLSDDRAQTASEKKIRRCEEHKPWMAGG